jgi:hypothetical protein
LNALLSGLPKGLLELLKDAPTSLNLNIDVEHKNASCGQYHHFGIAERLRKLKTKFEAKETVKMQVNIDGLALLCNCGQY